MKKYKMSAFSIFTAIFIIDLDEKCSREGSGDPGTARLHPTKEDKGKGPGQQKFGEEKVKTVPEIPDSFTIVQPAFFAKKKPSPHQSDVTYPDTCLRRNLEGSTHGATDVDTAWMKTTIQSHFSQPRNHVSGPAYKDQAKYFILKQFDEYGLETDTHTFSTGMSTVKGNNVIGVSKGKYFGTDKDRVVGVAAHYDTAKDTPGVDSNGAGVVGMLQAAKHLSKFPRDFTVMFVAFDFLLNEDNACTTLGCGSVSFMNEWVNSYWSTPPTTTGVIVMDTIMNFNDNQESQSLPVGFNVAFPSVVSSINSNNNKGDFLAVVGRPFDRDVLNKFIQSYTALGLTEFRVENIYISTLTESTVTASDIALYTDLMRSDHRTFWSRGVPSIFLTDTANFRGYMKTCFHKSCDDMSQVTDKMIQFAGKTTQAVIDTVNKLASTSPSSPISRAGVHRVDVSLLGVLGTLLWMNAAYTV